MHLERYDYLELQIADEMLHRFIDAEIYPLGNDTFRILSDLIQPLCTELARRERESHPEAAGSS